MNKRLHYYKTKTKVIIKKTSFYNMLQLLHDDQVFYKTVILTNLHSISLHGHAESTKVLAPFSLILSHSCVFLKVSTQRPLQFFDRAC